MKASEIQQEIEAIRKSFGKLESPVILRLLNLVEKLYKENQELRKENQALKDELNILKGEQAKPKFKEGKDKKDISSENERKSRKNNSGQNNNTNKKRNRKSKKDLPYHDVDVLEVDKSKLPEDAVFKGYSKKIVQGIKVLMKNMLVKQEIYYSPTQGCFTAEIPQKYKSGYLPEFQNFIIEMKYKYGMTSGNILEFLQKNGFVISAGSISNLLLGNGNRLSPERDSILEAGRVVSDYIQTDTTECIENGDKKQVHVFSGDLFSVFYTKEDRKRASVIDILRFCEKVEDRIYGLNNEFFEIIKSRGVAIKHQIYLEKYHSEQIYTHEEINEIFRPFDSRKNLKSLFYDVAYIAGFHAEVGYPAAQVLLTDDSSVYDHISLVHALCWIHEGRHFKKLNPIVIEFKDELDNFLTQYWDYYHTLLDYKQNPSDDFAKKLENQFDLLFTKVTPYEDLNERIRKLHAKKKQLLTVLKHSSIPLHNNGSELLARLIARYRDICLHTVSEAGTTARDIIYSIYQTAEKLEVNAKEYIIDRISGEYKLPSLADMILNYSTD